MDARSRPKGQGGNLLLVRLLLGCMKGWADQMFGRTIPRVLLGERVELRARREQSKMVCSMGEKRKLEKTKDGAK